MVLRHFDTKQINLNPGPAKRQAPNPRQLLARGAPGAVPHRAVTKG